MLTDSQLVEWLKEDIHSWDISTTDQRYKRTVSADIFSREAGTICGIEVVKQVFQLVGIHPNDIQSFVIDGTDVQKSDKIMEIKGEARHILTGERLALNLLGHMSGVATKTRNLVDRAHLLNPHVKIAGTRKTLPGLRTLQKYAIKMGGGDTHRMSLSDMVMLKENHLAEFESEQLAIDTAFSTKSFTHKIEVEVTNPNQAQRVAKTGKVDIIMLDNFSLEQITPTVELIKEINDRILIEVSGGINESNFESYVKTGVDIISMGALTHTTKPLDISLLIK